MTQKREPKGEKLPPVKVTSARKLSKQLLVSTPEEQQTLIRKLVDLACPDTGNSSWKEQNKYCHLFMDALLTQLLKEDYSKKSTLLGFFRLLDHLPLHDPNDLKIFLPLTLKADAIASKGLQRLLAQLELSYLLINMGDYGTPAVNLAKLEDQVDMDQPELYILHRLSKARYLQHKQNHRQLTSLWLDLICNIHRLDGAPGALQTLLYWIVMLDWGRETITKKALLQKLDSAMQNRDTIVSEQVLFQLFTLDDALVDPAEKMYYALRLLCRTNLQFAPQQLQHLYFFAGNFSSGKADSFPQSISFFQQSNYYLHKTWGYLRTLSRFLREQLSAREYVKAMPFMERRVMELGNQVSLQNNAFVETLNADYSTIDQLYKQVEELSITDVLTGLKNRRFMANNLHQMFRIAARHSIPVCLALMDIDLFKVVNDTHGHPTGDQVLEELAQLLVSFFRKSDIIIRYGGDEFLVVLFDTKPQLAVKLLEQLRKAIAARKFGTPDKPVHITISTGISFDPHSLRSEAQLLAKLELADEALYRAKHSRSTKIVLAE